ncbi:MAG: DUF6204 family protein [Acidimicrobiales bacterium]
MKVYRVVVRGQFDGLDDDQRAALLAEADEHDILRSAFTEWGTFTYDERLVAFNFRYEVRIPDDPAGGTGGDPPTDPTEVGLARTRAQLAEWGLGHKHLRATATDMASVWQP